MTERDTARKKESEEKEFGHLPSIDDTQQHHVIVEEYDNPYSLKWNMGHCYRVTQSIFILFSLDTCLRCSVLKQLGPPKWMWSHLTDVTRLPRTVDLSSCHNNPFLWVQTLCCLSGNKYCEKNNQHYHINGSMETKKRSFISLLVSIFPLPR